MPVVTSSRKIRQPFDHVAGKRSSLPHHANDLKCRKRFYDIVTIAQQTIEYRKCNSRRASGPISRLQNHVLIVVEDRALILVHAFLTFRRTKLAICARLAPYSAWIHISGTSW